MNKGVVFIFLIFVGFVSAGQSYYVSNSGDDSNSGTSPAQAWKTIGKVNANVSGVGDDVYFNRGDEWHNEQLAIDWSGNAGDAVVIGAYGSGDKPIISGTDKFRDTANPFPLGSTTPGQIGYVALVTSSGKSYITFQDLHVQESAGRGIVANGNASFDISNIVVQRCTINGLYRNTWFRNVENLTLVDNDFYDGSCITDSNNIKPGIVTILKSNNVLVRNNNFHDTAFEGLYVQDCSDVLIENNVFDNIETRAITLLNTGEDHDTENITIRRNLIYGGDSGRYSSYYGGVNSGVSINDGSPYSVVDVYIYGNLISDVQKGIYFAAGMGADPPYVDAVQRIFIYNNVLVDCSETIHFVLTRVRGYENIVIQNNIFAHYTTGLSHEGIGGERVYFPGITGGNNLWYGNISSIPESISDASDIIGDPRLNKLSGWNGGTIPVENDFGLREGSPAINAGRNLGVPYNVDYFGNVRSGAWDVGAIEYGGVSPPQETCANQNHECCNTCNGNGYSVLDSTCSSGLRCCDSCQIQISSKPEYRVVKANVVPIIDGDISEFSNANIISIVDSNAVLGLAKGTKGEIKLMWDEDALYVGAIINDSKLNANLSQRDDKLWFDDSISISFDTENNNGLTYGEDDYIFLININNVLRDFKGGAERESWNMNLNSFTLARGTVNNDINSDVGYIVEIRIPWGSWGVGNPSENETWGMEFAINDIDENNERTQVGWASTDISHINNPSEWGALIFSGQNNVNSTVLLSDIFVKISEWKAGRVSLSDVFGVIRGWGRGK